MWNFCKNQFNFKNQKIFKWLNKYLFEKCFFRYLWFYQFDYIFWKNLFCNFCQSNYQMIKNMFITNKKWCNTNYYNFYHFWKKKIRSIHQKIPCKQRQEIYSQYFENYYTQKNINSISLTPYIFQQNDAAERINRTLINKIKIMLTKSKWDSFNYKLFLQLDFSFSYQFHHSIWN